MPLTSVQLYLQRILDGMPVPGTALTLEAQITPPVVQDLDGPIAFVWGGTLVASRQSGPRGVAPAAAFKKLLWDADVWLVYLTNPDDPSLDLEFPQLVDAVMAALWSTPMAAWIDALGNVLPGPVTDPPEGASQILSIGEDFRMEYSPVHTPATLRMLYYTARLGLQIYEAVQA